MLGIFFACRKFDKLSKNILTLEITGIIVIPVIHFIFAGFNTMAQDWTKETLRAWLLSLSEQAPETISQAQRGALTRGLLFLYDRQTADEQSSSSTSHNNGMGFSGIDAKFLSSVAQSAKRYGNITPNQSVHVAKKLAKYTGQLLELVNAKQAA